MISSLSSYKDIKRVFVIFWWFFCIIINSRSQAYLICFNPLHFWFMSMFRFFPLFLISGNLVKWLLHPFDMTSPVFDSFFDIWLYKKIFRFGAVACETSIPHGCWFDSWFLHFLSDSLLMKQEKWWKVAQVLGPLCPHWGIQMQLLAPGFHPY